MPSMTSGDGVAVSDLRENISNILDEVEAGRECVITRHGRAVAVILDIEEYESLVETLNILSDDDTMDALAEAELDLAEGRVTSED